MQRISHYHHCRYPSHIPLKPYHCIEKAQQVNENGLECFAYWSCRRFPTRRNATKTRLKAPKLERKRILRRLRNWSCCSYTTKPPPTPLKQSNFSSKNRNNASPHPTRPRTTNISYVAPPLNYPSRNPENTSNKTPNT